MIRKISILLFILTLAIPALAREHRVLKDGVLTVTPFTAAEEAVADQQDADALAAETLFNSGDQRMDRAFTSGDRDRILFEVLFELRNRTIALEGGVAMTRAQFKAFLKGKLP